MPATLALRHLIPVLFLACAPAMAADSGARAWLVSQGYAPPSGSQIVACHGYGCSRRAILSADAWLARASALLNDGGASPASERRALGEAIGLYTGRLAARFGGRPDEPGSPPSLSGVHGQMDCLDVTANVISMLLVLEERGLLRHHEVAPPQSRGMFLDGRWPHFTAVIGERNGARWALDPWRRAPGQRPEILPLERWQQASR
jgi:hypothetical protein